MLDTRDVRDENEDFGDPGQFRVPCPQCAEPTDAFEIESGMCGLCNLKFDDELEKAS